MLESPGQISRLHNCPYTRSGGGGVDSALVCRGQVLSVRTRRFASSLVLADTYQSIAGREDRILEGGVPQRSGDRSRRPVLPVGRRGQVGCRAAEGDGVRGRADVAGGAGAGQLGLDHPGSTATEMTSGNLRFQARARATSHALLSAYARRGSVSRPRAAGCGRADPARPEPSQSNRPCSSADSRWVSRCGARTFTAKVIS